MRRVYFVVDLSLLRGPNREAHLAQLMSTVARTYAAYFQADISFGYKLFDSSCGDCAVNSYLPRVAAELSKLQILNLIEPFPVQDCVLTLKSSANNSITNQFLYLQDSHQVYTLPPALILAAKTWLFSCL
jgi:hypothetical protein